MIWKLCKIFRVKPSDPFWDGMTGLEQAWLFTMVGQDQKEDFEDKLKFVEYLASFSNPEAIKEITEQRKRGRPPTDDEFAQMMKKDFGRAPKFQSTNKM